ncbi:MAG: biotin transporter BioY [Actinomycetales bacterium]|nr:biotin transporter BioY [Actinomycetales bacterium]
MPTTSTPADRTHAARRSTSTDVALISCFAALIAVLGIVPPIAVGLPVPITLQTMGVMLAGLVLGARRGALSVLVLLALVAVGLPLLSGGRGGLGVFAGPSAGYLVGFVLGAYVTGWVSERLEGRIPPLAGYLTAAVVGGIGAVYLIGIPVLVWRTGADPLASLVFLPGDLVKASLAAVVAVGVRRALPDR